MKSRKNAACMIRSPRRIARTASPATLQGRDTPFGIVQLLCDPGRTSREPQDLDKSSLIKGETVLSIDPRTGHVPIRDPAPQDLNCALDSLR